MINEPRPYASLSSGLLARKGTAKPAMRPQGFTGFEDLGWNDMGHDVPDAPLEHPIQEHVPSSIAALTPAPRPGRGDEAIDEDEHEEVEAPEYDDEAELSEQDDEPELSEQVDEPELSEQDAEPELCEQADEPARHEQAVEPEVIAQQRAIAETFASEPEPDPPRYEAEVAPRQVPAEIVALPKRPVAVTVHEGRKSAFTLRLDAGRHLRLRLATAVTGRSAQLIVTGALDAFLESIPELEALAERVPPAKAKRN